jgi:glutaconyl-CoA/methylmalonyl-CoA decarboxylase subunit delta
MEGATSNPWLIALINMTIVFGVLITLGIIMKIIKFFDSMIMDKS